MATPHLGATLLVGLALGIFVGLGIGLAAIPKGDFETVRLSEPTDGIRFYPIAVVDRSTGEVKFCALTDTKPYRYSCR